MTKQCLGILFAATLLASCSKQDGSNADAASFQPPDRPECIAPSKPGGGFDLTCKLAQKGLMELKLISKPMRVTYQPGGIGAVAYNSIVAQRPGDGNVIVAFSGGSLLNLAQGKFGRYGEDDVRWIAAEGIDYGMVAVRADSPFQTLNDLVDALKQDPTSVVFGAGGTVGSQDWMKSALIAKAAGIDYKAMRYVAFEGGGEAQTALLGGYIQAYSGDISEERLPAPFDAVPTAKEQGYDVSWPILRGFYTGPDVSDADYDWWVAKFDKMMGDQRFDKMRRDIGMFPFAMTGAALDAEIKSRMAVYRNLAEEFGFTEQTG